MKKNSFPHEGMVVAAPLKTIYVESRCFVVDGRVITGSVYKSNGQYQVVGIVNKDVIDFAQNMAEKFSHPGFSIDVASTSDGLKIVELNCLNYSGFYSADLAKLIDALLLHYGE